MAKDVVSKVWSIQPSFDGIRYSVYPSGDKPLGNAYDSAQQDADFDALFAARFAAHGTNGTVYVRASGNDTTGTGTSGNPYATIGRGLQALVAGGTLIVGDGTYDGITNWVSTKQRTIPNGTSTNYTVIRAENRYGVYIRQTGSQTNYGDGPVYLGTGKLYIHVDGFIGVSTTAAPTSDENANYIFDLTGTSTASPQNCIVSRCIGIDYSCDQYGGTFGLGENNLFVLCTHLGSSRYPFYAGSGGSGATVVGSTCRLCFSYMPFGPSMEPTSSFAFYGNSGGTNVQNMGWLNCYEIKSPHIPFKAGQNSGTDLKWGSFYNPKGVKGLVYVGCGVVQCGGEYGAFCFDNDSGSNNTVTIATLDDCFVANFNSGSPGSAMAVRKAVNFGNLTINHFTAQGQPGAAFPASEWTGANNLTAGAIYPTLRVGENGCEQKYVVGPLFSKFGDTDWNVPQTSMKLWPIPYESYIKSAWATSITRPSQDVPTTYSASQDPLSGNSLNGQPQTLTRKIWEAFGNVTPSFATGAGVY